MEYCTISKFKIWIVVMVICTEVKSNMNATQCTGQTFSLTCGTEDSVIHVLYEIYFYDLSQDTQSHCIHDSSHCSQTEFIDPVSARYCNGHSQCSFPVTQRQLLPTCVQNATALTVLYKCISKNHMINICSPYSLRNGQQIYLTSPNYPNHQLEPKICRCNITGSNIYAKIFEYERSNHSNVVFMFFTNKATVHVNRVKIRNEILLEDMATIRLILDNRQYTDLFKLWMEIYGNGLNITCQTPSTEGTHSSTTQLQTAFYTRHISFTHLYSSSFWESENSYYTSSIYPASLITESLLNRTILTEPITRSNQVHLSSIVSNPVSTVSNTIQEALSISPVGLLVSSTVHKDPGNNQQQSDQDTDLRVAIVTVTVFSIIILISVAIGIFIHKRKQRQEENYNTSVDDDIGRNRYRSYHDNNFSFHSTQDID